LEVLFKGGQGSTSGCCAIEEEEEEEEYFVRVQTMNVSPPSLGLKFRSEDVGDTFLRNFGNYPQDCMRFEVLTAVKMSTVVFWFVTPCEFQG
jgi:hypothetical protein